MDAPEDSALIMSDGVRLAVRTWRPRTPAAGLPVLLFLHGIESHMEWFAESALALAGQGFRVRGFDRRGSGGSAGDRGHMADYRQILDDIEAVVAATRTEEGGVPVVGIGLSLGANFMLAAEARRPGLFAGIITLAAGIAPKVGFPLFRRLRILTEALVRPRAIHRVPIRDETLTRSPLWLRKVREDPLRTTRVTARFFLEILRMRRHLDRNAGRIRVPVLTILAERDEVVDNEAMIRWHGRLGSGDVTIDVVPDCLHCIQFETSGAEVADRIAGWVKSRHAGRAEDIAGGAGARADARPLPGSA